MRLLPVLLGMLPVLAGCSLLGPHRSPLPRAATVELERYLGPWHVIAAIPPAIPREAFDPMLIYSRNPDGSIVSLLQFRSGGFAGTLETRLRRARVQPGSGDAVWRLPAGWLGREQWVIAWVEPDYSAAIFAQEGRRQVWILSRTPHLPLGRLQGYKAKIAGMGYELGRLEEFPQNGDPPWR